MCEVSFAVEFILSYLRDIKIEGRIELTGRRGRRCMQLLNYLKGRRGYWKLKEEALDHTRWRTRFGRGCVLGRQTTE
jgi:hypothetical protein